MVENFKQAIEGIVHLGRIMCELAENQLPENAALSASDHWSFSDDITRARLVNPWFKEENTRSQLKALGGRLNESELLDWLSRYEIPASKNKTVAIIMAGNIPLVGFHDVLCALMCGFKVKAKLSSDDPVLLPSLMKIWEHTHSVLAKRVEFVEGKLEDFDAVIATGSNNSARYFHQYFDSYPHLIRKNRTSVAVLLGDETEEELKNLGNDVFKYFGLGCRNVTKVFIPQDFNLNRLFEAFFDFKEIVDHNKYANNYDYHKALWLMNKDELLDNGFLLVKEEDERLVSPVGSLFTQRYSNIDELEQLLENRREEIQCVVGKKHVPFGKAQEPALDDYADGVDTVQFLLTV
ncbi:MAG: acyl-CoA reductase [Flavobacteriales bacterium]